MSFERKRNSVGSIFSKFEIVQQCRRTGALIMRSWKFLDSLPYLFPEHIFQAIRQIVSPSRRRVCGVKFFSHLRSVVYRLDARLIFQLPSADFACPELCYPSNRHLLSAPATRGASYAVVLKTFLNLNVRTLHLEVAPGPRCASLHSGSRGSVFARGSLIIPGAPRRTHDSGM